MNLLKMLMVVVVAGLGYMAYDTITKQQKTIAQLQAEIQILRNPVTEPEDQPAEKPEPFVIQKITCPYCGGEGQLMLRQPSGLDKGYGCPICGSVGYKNVRILEGYALCPDCAGMGRRLYSSKDNTIVGFGARESTSRMTSKRCARCTGMGCLKNPRL